jgi:hypothetical protein
MAGDVWQWTERLVNDTSRGLRGGTYGSSAITLSSMAGFSIDPAGGFIAVGFHVAMIPEPSTGVLAALGFALAAWGWRRKR